MALWIRGNVERAYARMGAGFVPCDNQAGAVGQGIAVSVEGSFNQGKNVYSGAVNEDNLSMENVMQALMFLTGAVIFACVIVMLVDCYHSISNR